MKSDSTQGELIALDRVRELQQERKRTLTKVIKLLDESGVDGEIIDQVSELLLRTNRITGELGRGTLAWVHHLIKAGDAHQAQVNDFGIPKTTDYRDWRN